MSPATIQLRPYQIEAVKAVEAALNRGVRRPAAVLATGLGKTPIAASLIERWHNRSFVRPGGRTLFIAHRDELIKSAVEKINDVAPGLRVGVVKGQRNETRADVVVASVATLARSEARRRMVANVDMVIVDECFPAGTLVGDRRIEDLRAGDLVPSYDENTGDVVLAPVVQVMRKAPSSLVRVTTEGGESFVCTSGHPVMTDAGWAPAGSLPHGARLLWSEHDATAGTGRGALHSVSGDRPTGRPAARPVAGLAQARQGVLLGSVPGRVGERGFGATHGEDQSAARVWAHEAQQSDGATGSAGQDGGHAAGDSAHAEISGWEWKAGTRASAETGGPARVADGAGMGAKGRQFAVSLQAGYRAPDDDGLRRGGRRVSLRASAPRIGRSPGRSYAYRGVVGVQVLEPGGDGTYGGMCPDGFVYNLEVEGTHTYVVGGGLIAHNCHHAAAESYLRVLAHYGAWGDGEPVGQSMRAVAIGFTATMQRGDDLALGDVWQEVVFVMGVAEGVRSGFLSRPRGIRVTVDDLDLVNVKKTRGEFQNGDLGRAVEESMAPGAIAKAIWEHSPTEPGLVFTPTVHSAQVVAEAMAATGLRTEAAWGAMGDDNRASVLKRFKGGDLDWIVNAQLFTEGTDLPRARTAVIARPTKSPVLLAQMAGRVLRLYRDPKTGVLKNTSLLMFVDGRTSGYSLNGSIELYGDKPAEIAGPREKIDEEIADPELEFDLGLGDGREPREREEAAGRDGKLVSEEVDLFGSSKSAWGRTRGGIWFLPAGERLIALVPGIEAGTWDVTAMDAKQHGTGRWVATGVHELSYAMAWAEADVTASEKTTAARDRGWRKAKTIEGSQLDFARRLGYVVHPGMTKGEVSDMIATSLASNRIDPHIPDYAKGR